MTTSSESPTRRWLREPLLHFLLLGAVLFGVDHVLVGETDDPNTIVLSAQADQDIRQLFSNARGRAPTAEELTALRARWLDNEVLYREGLALQVDRGDSAIRERVIFKALSVVDANVKLPPIDDDRLREWFESQRDRYDQPARFDFQEAVLSGDSSEAAVRAFVDELNRGVPADTQAGLRVFKARPHPSIVQTYGGEFAAALETAPVGAWQAHATGAGAQAAWRAMRLEAVTPAQPARFEALRGVVLQDWTDATMSEQRTAAVRVLARKYALVVEDAPQ